MPVIAETVDKVEEDQRHVSVVALVDHFYKKFYRELVLILDLIVFVILNGIQHFEANEVYQV